MKWKFFTRKIDRLDGLFNGHFVEVKALYALYFDAISCISFIGEIDTSKAFVLIREKLRSDVVEIFQHAYFGHNDKRMFFNNTVFVLKNKRMVELGENYCQLLHTPDQHAWANDLIEELAPFRIVNNENIIGFTRQPVAN